MPNFGMLTPVKSSHIAEVGYDYTDKILYIRFHVKGKKSESGPVYSYAFVEKKMYEAMMKAKSLGSYFHENIKDNPKIIATKM